MRRYPSPRAYVQNFRICSPALSYRGRYQMSESKSMASPPPTTLARQQVLYLPPGKCENPSQCWAQHVLLAKLAQPVTARLWRIPNGEEGKDPEEGQEAVRREDTGRGARSLLTVSNPTVFMGRPSEGRPFLLWRSIRAELVEGGGALSYNVRLAGGGRSHP